MPNIKNKKAEKMNDTPIIINLNLIRKFQQQGKDFANLLGLYTFYITHAQLQKTNRPLATDSFTAHGLNWGIDKVKRIKRILKDLEVIGVVQVRKYYYVHLFFIYTKKKIGEVLGGMVETNQDAPIEKEEENKKDVKEELKEQEVKEEKPTIRIKSLFELTLIDEKIHPERIKKIRGMALDIKKLSSYTFDAKVFAKWCVYCDRNSIPYATSNLEHWIKKLDKRTSVEQEEAVYKAIEKGWKDFYLEDIKYSRFHAYLGKDLKIDGKECLVLQNVSKEKDKFILKFSNITVKTNEPIETMFGRCEYYYDGKSITAKVKKVLLGAVKKF